MARSHSPENNKEHPMNLSFATETLFLISLAWLPPFLALGMV